MARRSASRRAAGGFQAPIGVSASRPMGMPWRAANDNVRPTGKRWRRGALAWAALAILALLAALLA